MAISITQPDLAADPASIDPASIRALAEGLARRDGAPPLSDQALSRLGTPDVQHLLAEDGGRLVGYAQVDGDTAEIAAGGASLEPLLCAVQALRPELTVWAHGRRSPLMAVLDGRGYQRVRVLWQLRRPVTAVEPAAVPAGITIRTFLPGIDEADWLATNAAAFAHHAEQGGMTLADLLAREDEGWFDPNGFFLAYPARDPAEGRGMQPGQLLGFHWTKVHPDGLGEVYVLGVAPEAQGSGLGAALLATGLLYLGGREILLYVDESNATAKRLYEHSGFTEYDLDVQFRVP